MGKNKTKLPKQPFVSICTPTFNRRPFIQMAIKCFEHQTYPKDKMEWIIIDDGTDKIEDLVSHIPQVRYFKYDEKLTLGKKRNISNEKAKGDIIVYMDDDDYYPPERVKHAVERLKESKALCAGSSAMFIYFKHIDKMYQFGPYGPNHSTAASFAFKRELLNQTRFDEESSVAEERTFLKGYTIPVVQLDSSKTILVFSHTHNSFDKKELLKQMPNPNVHETLMRPTDLVKETDILKFFMEDIDDLLNKYEPGHPNYKQDVKKQTEYQDTMNKINMLMNPQNLQEQINNQTTIIQQLTFENNQLKEKIEYLNVKVKQLIMSQMELKKNSQSISMDI